MSLPYYAKTCPASAESSPAHTEGEPSSILLPHPSALQRKSPWHRRWAASWKSLSKVLLTFCTARLTTFPVRYHILTLMVLCLRCKLMTDSSCRNSRASNTVRMVNPWNRVYPDLELLSSTNCKICPALTSVTCAFLLRTKGSKFSGMPRSFVLARPNTKDVHTTWWTCWVCTRSYAAAVSPMIAEGLEDSHFAAFQVIKATNCIHTSFCAVQIDWNTFLKEFGRENKKERNSALKNTWKAQHQAASADIRGCTVGLMRGIPSHVKEKKNVKNKYEDCCILRTGKWKEEKREMNQNNK